MYNGVSVYHVYGGEFKKEKSYWDDTAFRQGSQWVSVAYVHPRYSYESACSDIAYSLVDGFVNTDWKSTPNYKKVGKSRKKVVSYTLGETCANNNDFFARIEVVENEILRTGDVVIVPSINVTQTDYSRFVEICIPEEILCEDDLVRLCDIVRNALSDPNYLKTKYIGYSYTKDDYNRENTVDKVKC